MLKQLTVILSASLVLTTACSDTDTTGSATGPSALLTKSSQFASVTPSTLSAQLNDRPSCPEIQPLRVRASLVVLSDDDTTLFVREVRMRFTDQSGIPGPQVTLPAPLPITPFGTALVQARSQLTFPLDFSFGCGTDRRGTLVIVVNARDGRGLDRSTEVRVGVR
jgi:hypothetical protein